MSFNKTATIDWSAFQQARIDRQLTLRDIEEFTGVKKSTISNLENSNHVPRGDDALKLYIFYGLSPDDILLDKPKVLSNTLDKGEEE